MFKIAANGSLSKNEIKLFRFQYFILIKVSYPNNSLRKVSTRVVV
jgi:hypothetical protein